MICRSQYAAGKKVGYTEYKIGMLYDDQRNKYYTDYEEMLEDYSEYILENCDEDSPEPADDELKEKAPKWLFGCEEIHFKVRIDPAIEDAEEEMYEDFEGVVDREELEQFVEQWNKKQTGVSYCPDYKTVVVFE